MGSPAIENASLLMVSLIISTFDYHGVIDMICTCRMKTKNKIDPTPKNNTEGPHDTKARQFNFNKVSTLSLRSVRSHKSIYTSTPCLLPTSEATIESRHIGDNFLIRKPFYLLKKASTALKVTLAASTHSSHN